MKKTFEFRRGKGLHDSGFAYIKVRDSKTKEIRGQKHDHILIYDENGVGVLNIDILPDGWIRVHNWKEGGHFTGDIEKHRIYVSSCCVKMEE